jgi:PncC family amidohydrolase
MNQKPLEQQIHSLLTDLALTLSAAESCTGGLVAWRVTTIPGSSEYFLGSIVAYSNEMKHKALGVSEETLANRGAVSEECAREMAEGVRQLTGSSIAVSTTGIAGPGGATARKPVGLIYVACATERGTKVRELRLTGDRDRNMRDAAEVALELVIEAVSVAA